MGQHFLYLVRHGQQANPDRTPDQLGNGLTPAGRQQARRIARRLGAALAGAPPPVIHHSSMRRAAETAAFIAGRLPAAPLRPTRLLWEIPAVSVPPAFAHWFTRFSPEQVAQGQAQAERAYQRFFQAARGRDRRSVLVCHGNVIRYFVTRVLGMPADAWLALDTLNAGLTEMVIEADGRVRVVTINDVGHLPTRLRTFI
jgi:serine/threonine-protein phosphatase PGAM5